MENHIHQHADSERPLSRRGFAKHLGGAALGAAVAAPVVGAATAKAQGNVTAKEIEENLPAQVVTTSRALEPTQELRLESASHQGDFVWLGADYNFPGQPAPNSVMTLGYNWGHEGANGPVVKGEPQAAFTLEIDYWDGTHRTMEQYFTLSNAAATIEHRPFFASVNREGTTRASFIKQTVITGSSAEGVQFFAAASSGQEISDDIETGRILAGHFVLNGVSGHNTVLRLQASASHSAMIIMQEDAANVLEIYPNAAYSAAFSVHSSNPLYMLSVDAGAATVMSINANDESGSLVVVARERHTGIVARQQSGGSAAIQEWQNSNSEAQMAVESDGLLAWVASGLVQTTVGADGAASEPPQMPVKYLKVDVEGTTLVIPAYNAS